ncbi:MAG TPA: hypothetical protein VIM57_06995 [Luteolibacter sp.]
MTSDPNEPDAGSIPSPRPDAPKKASEDELWDLEDTPANTTPLVPVNRAKPDLSSPAIQPGKAIEQQPRQVGHSRINPSGNRKTPFQSDPHRVGALGDMGELDTGWEDASVTQPAESTPKEPVSRPKPAEPPVTPSPVSVEAIATIAPGQTPEEKAETPAEPASTKPTTPRTKLSLVEKTGLVLLVVLLLLSAAAFVIASWKRLPVNPTLAKPTDFPVKGNLVTVKQVATFWRVPTEQDHVRRETKMIPVVTLELEGGPAGLRIFFRNAQNEVVGDSVTRTAQAGTFEFAATSGFEADGMHAAYRTGESKPWKVEVFEAPSADSPRQEFHKLFETPISSDRR